MSRADLTVAKAPRGSGERHYADRFRPECAPVEIQLVDATTAGRILGGISAAMVEKLRRNGMPAIDLAQPDPEKRTRHKGLYLYDPAALRSWWQKRAGQP